MRYVPIDDSTNEGQNFRESMLLETWLQKKQTQCRRIKTCEKNEEYKIGNCSDSFRKIVTLLE